MSYMPNLNPTGIISFSLWGDNPIYCYGAIANAKLAKLWYPGWVCRFYCGESVPEDTIQDLLDLNNVEIILEDEVGDWTGMFWRFKAASDTDLP